MFGKPKNQSSGRGMIGTAKFGGESVDVDEDEDYELAVKIQAEELKECKI